MESTKIAPTLLRIYKKFASHFFQCKAKDFDYQIERIFFSFLYFIGIIIITYKLDRGSTAQIIVISRCMVSNTSLHG